MHFATLIRCFDYAAHRVDLPHDPMLNGGIICFQPHSLELLAVLPGPLLVFCLVSVTDVALHLDDAPEPLHQINCEWFHL